jgi:hypothetical protein|tara:strand:+ start:872 stop:1081 length:210 start_codon:yes stop_codon:yes gene_type:complete
MVQTNEIVELDLREFFDAYDRGEPHMISAVSDLYCQIREHAPQVLNKESSWYQTWIWGGKRNLKTGERL